MDLSRYERALRRILFELRPYRDEIVVIGGWVPYLYRRVRRFQLMEREHLADGRGGRAGGPPAAAT